MRPTRPNHHQRCLVTVLVPVLIATFIGLAHAQPQSFRFAAIADTHIANGDHLARFRQFVYTLGRQADVDFLLVLGDVCGHAPEMLPGIKNVIDHANLTVYPLPGNHDDNYAENAEWYRSVFGPMHYTFDHKGWHFVMNWSQSQPIAWLAKDLASVPPDRPVVFCQHYPPDPAADLTADQPWPTVLKYANVKLILSGHTHRFADRMLSHVRSLTLANFNLARSPQRPTHYYLFETTADGQVRLVDQKPLAKMKQLAPPDRAPLIAMDASARPPILRGSHTFAGSASDDNALATVEYSLDRGPWRKADGTTQWRLTLDTATLADGHHLLTVRATDAIGQFSLQHAETLLYVEHTKPTGRWFRFQQGVNGYNGCRDVTIRKHHETKKSDGSDGRQDDLENWVWRQGQVEYSEFYIRFDLAKSDIPPNARIKTARLVLFGSRQNSFHATEPRARYAVGVPREPWSDMMTFKTRPAQPGWSGQAALQPKPAIEGAWPYLGGTQIIWPPQPVTIDLTPLRHVIQQWLAQPDTNHGVVISPIGDASYNMSAKSSDCPLVSLRPRLEIEIE